jgi:stage III sporulation protein AE
LSNGGKNTPKALLCLLLLCLCLGLSFAAEESPLLPGALDLIEGIDLGPWQQQTPGLDIKALLLRFASGDFAMEDGFAGGLLRESALKELANCLPKLLRVTVVALILSLLTTFRAAFQSDDTARLCEMIAYLTAAVPLGFDFMALVDQGQATINTMNAIAKNVLPTMISLLASIGAGVSAAAIEPLVLVAGSFIADFLRGVLLFALRLMAVLVIVNSLTEDGRFSKLLKLARTFIGWTLGTCFTSFLGLLAMKGMGGGVFDSVALRATKYAVDSLVPVVGGLFKDSVETLAGCSMIVKNAVGLTGMLSLCAALLAPGVSILVVVAEYRLCAAILQPLGNTRLLQALDDFASVLTLLFITLLTVAAIFFVFLATLMMIGSAF